MYRDRKKSKKNETKCFSRLVNKIFGKLLVTRKTLFIENKKCLPFIEDVVLLISFWYESFLI